MCTFKQSGDESKENHELQDLHYLDIATNSQNLNWKKIQRNN